MKRIVALLLCSFLLFAAVACGDVAVNNSEVESDTSALESMNEAVESLEASSSIIGSEPEDTSDLMSSAEDSDEESKTESNPQTKPENKPSDESKGESSQDDETSEPSEKPSNPVVKPQTPKEPGDNILLCYISQAYNDTSISKDEFIPSVAYMKDGVITDFMFDSFIFLCSPNYLYNYSSGSAYLKPFTKNDWSNYITNKEFKSNKNINALDSAVGEVKAALGKSNYKAKVYMTLFYPVETVKSFGYVDGKNLNFSNLEDRNLAMKWMVDESVRQFNAQNYQNLELAGFYWFCEEIYETSGDGKKIAKYTTDYIRSLGMKTAWCPYFHAEGYKEWKSLGFDIATQQANYFPEHRSDWPNKGNSGRLYNVSMDSKLYGIGVGMEMADSEVASAKIFKEYMKAGIEYGFMYSDHIYYMDFGPTLVSKLSKSSNSTLRLSYDALYKFIHGTLTIEDLA